MPVLSSSRYAQAGVALDLARALLNNATGTLFTDVMLFPLLNSVYRELQRRLRLASARILTTDNTEDADIDLAFNGAGSSSAGLTQTELSDTTTEQLPVDCLYPKQLWERVTANPTDVFQPMRKFTSGGAMLNLQPSQFLRWWDWAEDKITFIGATQGITIRMQYAKSLPGLAAAADPVQIVDSADCLAFGTAAWATRSRGGKAFVDFNTQWLAQADLLKKNYTKNEQNKPRRRRSYGSRRRTIYL